MTQLRMNNQYKEDTDNLKSNWCCPLLHRKFSQVVKIWTLWLWRWLPHRLLKRQSLSTTTVLFRTTFTGRSNSTYFWKRSIFEGDLLLLLLILRHLIQLSTIWNWHCSPWKSRGSLLLSLEAPKMTLERVQQCPITVFNLPTKRLKIVAVAWHKINHKQTRPDQTDDAQEINRHLVHHGDVVR